MQGLSHIESITKGWESATGNAAQLLYPVAWDWRRDFWEQSQRVYDMVKYAHVQTGCKPIVIGNSFGGMTVYTAFARYKQELADHVAGVLYTVVPFQPSAATIACAPRLCRLPGMASCMTSHDTI